MGKSIDWIGQVVKDITLPIVTNISTIGTTAKVALSDDYLYVNYPHINRINAGYMFMGSNCI